MGLRNNSYLIHFDSPTINFPYRCPVCGKPASDKALIAASLRDSSPRSKQYKQSKRRPRNSMTAVRRLEIPVCRDHYYSVIETSRFKAACTVTTGILIMFFIFASLITIGY